MQKITLYRYNRTEGGVTVSPVKPNGEYTELFRLIADEGRTLTNGTEYVDCIDTENPSEWGEVATEEDYIAALERLGVNAYA